MIDVATLRAMAAAGASVDVILAAVEAAQKIEGERLAGKREKDAARQRRHRTARTCHTESQPVTRTECDAPPAYTTPPLEQKPKKVSVYIETPEFATDEARVFASSKGWDTPKTDFEWQRFRDHGIQKDRRHKGERGLSAAWRNWVTSPYQKPVENGNAQANQRQPGGAYGASKDRFREAFAELKAYNARQRDGGDGEIVEFLPAVGRGGT